MFFVPFFTIRMAIYPRPCVLMTDAMGTAVVSAVNTIYKL